MRGSFQSTHSLRSATGKAQSCAAHWPVSIHALLAECDSGTRPEGRRTTCFNPRTPCGVRRENPDNGRTLPKFQSTHSLRSATEQTPAAEAGRHGFNPRTPCGVRLFCVGVLVHGKRFQSTHSLRSATEGPHIPPYWQKVSIHALLAECDSKRHYAE